MRKVGVLGVNLEELSNSFGERAYNLSGANSGNLLFTNSIYSQVDGVEFCKLDLIDKNYYDIIVIPAANWINKNSDYGYLADALEGSNVRVIVLGLGSQLQSVEDINAISEGTKKFLRVISRLTSNLGVRGEFTKKALERLSIYNTIVMGCPSILTNWQDINLRPIPDESAIEVAFGSTRYHFPNMNLPFTNALQRDLYRYALEYNCKMFYQSELFEIKVLNREGVEGDIKRAEVYYDKDWAVIEKYIRNKGHFHTHFNEWSRAISQVDLYIGTRIHGCVIAMLSGTPAILIAHDNRTVEMAKSMGIPYITKNEFSIDLLSDMKSFTDRFDFNNYRLKIKENKEIVSQLYTENGVQIRDCNS